MNFKVIITLDENYYNEAYEELMSSNKFKKWEPFFAGTMIIVGFILYTYDSHDRLGFFPFIFIAVGVFEFIKTKTNKRKWIKSRLDSKLIEQPIEMEFSDESIKHSGPFSNGTLKWTGIKAIIKSDKGIILKPETGINIYLPYKIFSSTEEINFILSKNGK